jgi:hypothetical protein
MVPHTPTQAAEALEAPAIAETANALAIKIDLSFISAPLHNGRPGEWP